MARILHWRIYDRWGGTVWTIEDRSADDPLEGWSGQWRGQQVPTGLYVWTLQVQLLDGSVRTYGGETLLLR